MFRRWSRISIGVKVMAACVCLTCSVSLIGSYVYYREARQALRNELRVALSQFAACSVLQVDPRLHESLVTPADESSPAYKELRKRIAAVEHSNPRVKDIYTLRPTSNRNTLTFVVDGDPDPKSVAHVGEKYDASDCPQMINGLKSPSADAEPIRDKWGTWLSGYAPVRDASGKVVAVLGVDMSVEQLRSEESALVRAAVNTGLIGLLLSLLVSLIMTRAVCRILAVFTSAAKQVCMGDFDCRIYIRSSDELNHLADSFNNVVGLLRETNERLIEATGQEDRPAGDSDKDLQAA